MRTNTPPQRTSSGHTRHAYADRPSYRNDYRDQAPSPSINEPLVPSTTPKTPSRPSLTEDQLFVNQRIGSFELVFRDEGEAVKEKKADGYLTLKPRGGQAVTACFLVRSEVSIPARKVLIREITAFYSRSSDYKLNHLHLDAK